jgi:hypothetical protein
MAKVTIDRRDAEDGYLPDVCMVCGDGGTTPRGKQFSWHPPWVYVLFLGGLVPFVIVAVLLSKRMKIDAPLCPRHRGHWMWRGVVVIGGLLLVLLLGFVSVILIAELERNPRFRNLGGWVCGGVLLLALVWLVVAVIFQSTAIRPTEITDWDMTLVKVSQEFADAYNEEAAERRERRRLRRREAPRRRYLDDDEDEEDYGRRD